MSGFKQIGHIIFLSVCYLCLCFARTLDEHTKLCSTRVEHFNKVKIMQKKSWIPCQCNIIFHIYAYVHVGQM